eukprot:1565141-Pleurochrysis_carterae.AAC.2
MQLARARARKKSDLKNFLLSSTLQSKARALQKKSGESHLAARAPYVLGAVGGGMAIKSSRGPALAPCTVRVTAEAPLLITVAVNPAARLGWGVGQRANG